jgi:DNA polymerase elongation subunit (family B)
MMTGHSINGFDLYYLHHRIKITSKTQVGFDDTKLKIKGLPIGRDDSDMTISPKTSQFRKDGSQAYDYHKCNIFGREIIDGFFVSIRYDIGRNFPSYGLKPIIQHLGLEKEGRIKWDFEKDDPAKIWDNLVPDSGVSCTVRGFNECNCEICTPRKKWAEYKEYCIDDADDSLKVFDIMIPNQFFLAKNLPMTIQNITETATGRQINMFLIRGYLQEKHSIPKPELKRSYKGAISIGIPGVYENVFGLDFAALYPNIMRQWKVKPKGKDPLNLFGQSVEYFAVERNKNKKIANDLKKKKDKTPEEFKLMGYYDNLQNSQKTVANSFYGFLGTQGLHFNCFDSADFITAKGRELFEQVLVWATGEGEEFWREKL